MAHDNADRKKREQDLFTLWNRAKNDCENLHKRIEKYERLYDLEHYNGVPKSSERRITLSTYTNVVDLAVGILTAEELIIKALSATRSPSAEKDHSLAEQLLDGILYINSERQERDLRYDWTFHQVRDGMVALRTWWDPVFDATQRTVADRDGQAVTVFDELPLVVQVIPGKYIYPVAGGRTGRWKAVFYAHMRSVFEVESEHGPIDKYKSLSEMDKMAIRHEYIDYWGEVQAPLTECPTCELPRERYEQVCVNCGSEEKVRTKQAADGSGPVLTWKYENGVMFEDRVLIHPHIMDGYRDNPYTLMFFKPVGSDKPENWGHSILRPIEELVGEKEWRLNRQTRLLNMYASLPLVARTRDGRKVQASAAFGDVPNLRLDESLDFPTWPGTPPDFKEQLQMIEGEIQEGSFPSAVYGEGPNGISGYAMSQMGESGRIRLTQPQKQQERVLAIWARKVFALLQSFAPDIAVQVYGELRDKPYAATLTGNETRGMRVNIGLVPVFPQDEVRKTAMSTQSADILSQATRLERYHNVQQPDQEQDRKIEEMVTQHPIMMEYQMLARMKELAREGDELAAMVLQRIQQQGVQEQPGPKPQPRNPEQTPGLPAQLPGFVSPQEAGAPPPGQNPAGAVTDARRQMAGASLTGEI